jgi:hypothetical protein
LVRFHLAVVHDEQITLTENQLDTTPSRFQLLAEDVRFEMLGSN